MKKQEIKKALKDETQRIMFSVLGYAGLICNESKYVVVSTDENDNDAEVIDALTLAGVNCFVRAETQKGRNTRLYTTLDFLTMLHETVEIA